jgi:serine/threonine protein kinase
MHLVFEYVQHDLAGIIHSTTVISEDHARHIMKQLLHGVALCHSIHVVHRDLKPANVLVMNDSTIKIADFGLAKQILDRKQIQKLEVVTLWYRAPEVLLGDGLYGSAIDMWSVGCIMAELMTKQYLFRGENNDDQLEKIMMRCGTPQSVGWDTRHLPKHYRTMNKAYTNTLRRDLASCMWSDKAFDLLEKLLSVSPSKRISAHDALHHEWFAKDGKPMVLPKVTCLNEKSCRKVQQQPVHGPPLYVPRLQQGPLLVPNPHNRDVRVFSQEQFEFSRRQQPPVNQHYDRKVERQPPFERHIVPRPVSHHYVNYHLGRSRQPVQPQIRTHKRPYESEEEERSRKRHKH